MLNLQFLKYPIEIWTYGIEAIISTVYSKIFELEDYKEVYKIPDYNLALVGLASTRSDTMKIRITRDRAYLFDTDASCLDLSKHFKMLIGFAKHLKIEALESTTVTRQFRLHLLAYKEDKFAYELGTDYLEVALNKLLRLPTYAMISESQLFTIPANTLVAGAVVKKNETMVTDLRTPAGYNGILLGISSEQLANCSLLLMRDNNDLIMLPATSMAGIDNEIPVFIPFKDRFRIYVGTANTTDTPIRIRYRYAYVKPIKEVFG